MSLVAWWPMNGNLNDYSGNANSAIPTGNIIKNAIGKIGETYNFSSGAYLTTDRVVFGDVFSISVWIKKTSVGENCIYNCRTKLGSGISLFILNGKPRFDTTDQWTINFTVDLNKWTHFTFIKNKAVKQFFVNGQLHSEMSSSSTLTDVYSKAYIGASAISGTSHSNFMVGSINDLRIYNHALSAKEVYEISKAKIMHYDFNICQQFTRNEFGNEIMQTSASNGGFYHWGSTGHKGSYGQNTNKSFIFKKEKQYSHWIADDVTATSNFLMYKSPEFAGGYRSLQAIIKSENGAEITENICYPSWNDNSSIGTAPNKWTEVSNLGDGFYLCKCEGIYQKGSNDLIGIYVCSGNKIYVSEMKVENAIRCSDIFSYETSTCISDCSGFKNQSIMPSYDTTPIYDLRSIIGSSCIALSGNRHVQSKPVFPSTIGEFTISMWFNEDVFKNSHLIWRPSNMLINLTSATEVRARICVSGDTWATELKATTGVRSGWNHIAFTFNEGIQRIYFNGINIAENTIMQKTCACDNSQIMYVGSRTGYDTITAKIDDVQFYTTALSESDIVSLYQERGAITKNGRLMIGEIVEGCENNRVNKKGQLETDEIVECFYEPSLLDYSTWSLNESPLGWYVNGSLNENARIIHNNPRGNKDMMWVSPQNDTTSNADGGFDTPKVSIDNSKKYRFSVWLKRENSGNGRSHFGLHAFNSSDANTGVIPLTSSTANTNPYFGSLLVNDYGGAIKEQWALFVSYVHPKDYSGTIDPSNGIYLANGTKKGQYQDFKWNTDTVKTRLRTYLFYSTSTTEKQYFYRPRIDLCDGSEPSIETLLSCSEHLPLVDEQGIPYPQDVFAFGKNNKAYSTEFIEQ